MSPRLHLALLLALSSLAACRTPGDPAKGELDGGALQSGEDNDSDGFFGEEDCNDDEAAVSPGAVELCDGIDNDCDGLIDEDVDSEWFLDVDGDGFGDPGAPTRACEAPAGAVPSGTDCDDGDAAAFPGAEEACDGVDNDCDGEVDDGVGITLYADADGDGAGDPDAPVVACGPGPGLVEGDDDCDDGNPDAAPGLDEVCDEVDNDCDGTVDEDVNTVYWADLDGDGWGSAASTSACAPPAGYAARNGDCDDGDGGVNPDAAESCNTVDDDCDGDIDEPDAFDALTFYTDGDGDAYGDPLRPVVACALPPGAVANDLDCDDGALAINPAAAERCNGVDDDCDTLIDTADASLTGGTTAYADTDRDGYGDPARGVTTCGPTAGTVSNDDDCDDRVSGVNPAAAERCNGYDDDCDALVDASDPGLTGGVTLYPDSDGDGFGASGAATAACGPTAGYVSDGTDCNDSSTSISPIAAERCNSIDDDCDRLIDDADPGRIGAATWYVDADRDGYGGTTTRSACTAPAGTVASSTDCDDGLAGVNPGAVELCNALDDDCDGAYDEGYDADTDGITDCEEISYTISISATGDDVWQGYVDGVSYGTYAGWNTVDTITLTLDSGDHVFAAYAQDTGAAIAGFLATVRINGTLSYWTGRDFVMVDNTTSPSWTAVGFDDSAWTRPLPCSAASVSSFWANQPTSLLSTGAQWVWHTSCTGLGDSYYRLEFSLP
jgi:hypothetical protein